MRGVPGGKIPSQNNIAMNNSANTIRDMRFAYFRCSSMVSSSGTGEQSTRNRESYSRTFKLKSIAEPCGGVRCAIFIEVGQKSKPAPLEAKGAAPGRDVASIIGGAAAAASGQ